MKELFGEEGALWAKLRVRANDPVPDPDVNVRGAFLEIRIHYPLSAANSRSICRDSFIRTSAASSENGDVSTS